VPTPAAVAGALVLWPAVVDGSDSTLRVTLQAAWLPSPLCRA